MKYYLIPIFYGLFLISPVIWMLGGEFAGYLAGFSLLLASLASLQPRPCGDGPVTRGRYGFFWPWAVKQCPICGDDLDSPRSR
jgi:hypothetical protein